MGAAKRRFADFEAAAEKLLGPIVLALVLVEPSQRVERAWEAWVARGITAFSLMEAVEEMLLGLGVPFGR